MSRSIFSLTLFAATVAAAADPRGDNPDAKPSTPQEQLKMFHVPPGFEVQLVAAEPEIQKPINLTFDAAGRLWVTGSELYPWPASVDATGAPIPDFAKAYAEIASAFRVGDKAPPVSNVARDTVRVLGDFDETGHARKISVFADGLNIPSGVQPLPRRPGGWNQPQISQISADGKTVEPSSENLRPSAQSAVNKSSAKGDSAIVYSIPNIWLLTDTDGDGKADKREVLYGTAGFLDTHGGMSSFLYWIDGWIYGTHGFRNHSELRDNTGRVTVLDSGNTYRFRPDGSAFEIYTHGQTNPFGLTVDPLGNFYSADSHSKPVYMLLRGAYYEGIGKQHDGLGFAPRITDDDHGSTAIAGIAYYAAEQFPEEYRGNLFNGNVVTQRINRDKLEWHGSTPRAIRQPDFLTCDDPWFRPVQIKLGPDGALWIADFYNPIIGHYEFPLADPRRDHTHGRIWRIVWRGDSADAIRGAAATPGGALGPSAASGGSPDARAGASKTANASAKGASPGVPGGPPATALGPSAPPSLPMPDLSGLAADDLVKKLADPNLIVRTLATNELVDRVGKDRVKPAASNATTDLLERLRSSENVQPLLTLWAQTATDDTELIHAVRVALRDCLVTPNGFENAQALLGTHPESADKTADVSLGAKTPEAAEFLLGHLGRTKLQGARSGEFLRHAVLYLPPEKLGAVAGLIESVKDAPLPQRLSVADNLAQAYRQRGLPLSDALTDWTQRTMLDALASSDDALLKRGVEAVRDVKLDAKLDPLTKIVRDDKREGSLRLAALEATANLPASRDLLVTTLGDPRHMIIRKRVAELLAQGGNTDAVLAALPNAPQELALAISGALAKTDAGCTALLDAIEAGKASPRLLLNKAVAGPLIARPKPLRDRAVALTKDLPPEDARLDAVIAEHAAAYGKAKPDATHGAQVFQQNCAVCHRFRNAGGNVGPALDGIAVRGPARLIEDILDPNRNVDPAFQQAIIETRDGRTFLGVNLRRSDTALTFTEATGKDTTLARADIKSQTISALSLMPPVFESALAEKDLADLLGYLLAP